MSDDPTKVETPVDEKPKIDPPVDEKPKEDAGDGYDPEKAMVEARAAQRTRLEEIGGKFDTNGDFIGFADQPSQPKVTPPVPNPDATVEDVLNAKFNDFETRVMGALQPATSTSVLTKVVESHPELAPYKGVATKMLEKTPTAQINAEYVLSLLYFARGQGADIEIAEARKTEYEKAKKDREQIEAGAAAGSEGGKGVSGGSSPKAKGEVTENIQKAADAWGMKAEDLASKVAEARKVAK
jgi:hypothetical protein